MSDKDDGGPAFPVVFYASKGSREHQELCGEIHSGMSLRQYTAIKAMQGILSNPNGGKMVSDFFGTDDIPRACYAIADEMIAEGKK